MMSPNAPGARWWKVDFHAHSPSSFDFGAAKEGEPSDIKPTFADWLLTYMRAGIDAIVVTDHNSHEGIDRARRARDELRESGNADFREIEIFPGAELTVDGNYHLLAIFDVSANSDDINGLLHTVAYQGERGTSNATTLTTFQAAIEMIHAAHGLAIPAHADGPAGLFGHNPPNVQAIVNQGLVAAVEITTEEGATRAEALEWVPVLGSDAHHLDGAGVPEGVDPKYPGSHYTWVKMNTPNLLGLKVALSDKAGSVIPSTKIDVDPNEFAHNIIERVVVRKGGQEAEHGFSPWMTAVIGGRGTGKSTLLELIRLALGRFGDLPKTLQRDLEWYSPSDGAERFWDATTEIDVYYARSDRHYRVLWEATDPNSSSIEVLTEDGWRAQAGDVQERFPVLINSQKQIYETAKDPNSLLKVIDAQPDIDMPGWLEEFRSLSSQYRTERAEVAEVQLQTSNRGRVLGEIADADAEIERRARLESSDEAKEFQALIEAQAQVQRRETASLALEDALHGAIGEFDRLYTPSDPDPDWEPEQQRAAAVEAAAETVRGAVGELNASKEHWDAQTPNSPRATRMAELRLQLEPNAADSLGAENFSDLLARRATLMNQLARIDRADKSLEALATRAAETLQAVKEQRAELTRRRQSFVAGLGDSELTVEVFEQAETEGLEGALRSLTQKSTAFDGVYEPTGLRSLLISNPKSPNYLGEIEGLKETLRQARRVGKESPLLIAAFLQFDQRFFTHLEGLDEGQFSTEVDLWFPDDSLNIRYRQDPAIGNLINLDQGSPGQKTAALLALLLQIGTEPLVLDQPEDDLDNRLIYDLVVKRLRVIKTSRQIIVVTHNANVVVNADSELVIVMKHGVLPEAERAGSIQDTAVKDDICLIMEGGKIAFRNRYGRLIDVL